MRLFIEPVDVWLFRDNKPFDAGSDHRAVSLFPPTPQVVAGALRSHHLVVQGVDLRLPKNSRVRHAYVQQYIQPLVGTAEEPPDGFHLRGPVIARWEAGKLVRYYPLPADAFLVGHEYRTLVPTVRPDGPRTNLPDNLHLLWITPYERGEEEAAPGGRWLAEKDLLTYLQQGAIPASNVIPGAELFITEDRLGIRLQDATRTTEEGLIYQVGFVRLKPQVGLESEVEGLPERDPNNPRPWPERGILKIGGEARAGRYSQLAENQTEPWPQTDGRGLTRFKLYFMTPACFSHGWHPADWGKWFDPAPRLVASAVSRPLVLGGFDLARGIHKPSRRYVPVGSVFFFEGEPRLKPGVEAISDFGARLGFGQFIIGRW